MRLNFGLSLARKEKRENEKLREQSNQEKNVLIIRKSSDRIWRNGRKDVDEGVNLRKEWTDRLNIYLPYRGKK